MFVWEVVEGKMRLNMFGKIVLEEWRQSAIIRQEIKLDEFVIMPNHIHGIVFILNNVGATGRSPVHRIRQKIPHGPFQKLLGAFIAGFKSRVTKRINILRVTPGLPVWHRNFYDRIIRNRNELTQIRQYIIIGLFQTNIRTKTKLFSFRPVLKEGRPYIDFPSIGKEKVNNNPTNWPRDRENIS